MGASNSTSTTNHCTNDSSVPPATCLCCIPRPRWPNMLHKLHRTLQQRLNFQSQKRRRASSRRSIGGPLLRPMPRCSSYGSSGTLLAASKSNKSNRDTHYAQWKCMFEGGKKHTRDEACLHDISEALSGQTTPKGFPSHTDPQRCQLPEVQKLLQQPVYDLVEEFKVRRRLSFRLPKLMKQPEDKPATIRRRPSARQKAAEAKLDKQLQKDLHDLEDYYGGFHYAQRNERFVRI
ncbi:uncharacterized protein Dwil_GK25291 [Drosophila willistoni]|uniref:Protein nullo n=1 Tax=Drosophila willistoni TaxID=7260 RepID=B4NEG5_DROWI|nr:protein nullo [Drosophila willistoni]EDW82134.1 uncharacterized protein Dwil_GK25291 [Drosophila willistoni]